METSPSVFIEGAAAVGKSTAVAEFLEKHMEFQAFFVDTEVSETLFLRENTCIVIENIPEKLTDDQAKRIAAGIRRLPPNSFVIMTGRNHPHREFLKLFWEQKLSLIRQQELYFNMDEIRALVKTYDSYLDPGELLRETGGWPGCVLALVRLSGKSDRGEKKTIRELWQSYEIRTYLQSEIWDTLCEEEKRILRIAVLMPMLTPELVAFLLRENETANNLENVFMTLERKGMLHYVKSKKFWRVAAVCKNIVICQRRDELDYLRGGEWYENRGYIREALLCYKELEEKSFFEQCIRTYYSKVPWMEIPYGEVTRWKDASVQTIYLRGTYYFLCGDFEKFQSEVRRAERKTRSSQCTKEAYEMYVNLTWLDGEISLKKWLEILKAGGERYGTMELYNMLGGSCTFLCGLRDLTGMFTCTRKEEHLRAEIWKKYLGEKEWRCYGMAKVDYEMEIGKKDIITSSEWEKISKDSFDEPWQLRLCHIYLIKKSGDYRYGSRTVTELENSLDEESLSVFQRNIELIRQRADMQEGKSSSCLLWLKENRQDRGVKVQENNWGEIVTQVQLCCRLNQYERALRMLRTMIPWLRERRRQRFLAEMLFLQAIAQRETGSQTHALTSMIESFVISSKYRYVRFYTEYGRTGKEILQTFVEWEESHLPEGYRRKKKYNYGNIVKMPWMDYLETVLRAAKKATRDERGVTEKSSGETITMMEMLILQELAAGQRNVDICKKMNITLPTVKSHLYNLYRKLGVSSRMQAVLVGKQRGIIK